MISNKKDKKNKNVNENGIRNNLLSLANETNDLFLLFFSVNSSFGPFYHLNLNLSFY